MADLDSPSKRASSVGILLGFALLVPPAPDGTIDQGDRQHIAWSYSGILATSGVITTPADRGYLLTKDDQVACGSEWRAPLTQIVTINAGILTWTPGLFVEELISGSEVFRVRVNVEGVRSARFIVNDLTGSGIFVDAYQNAGGAGSDLIADVQTIVAGLNQSAWAAFTPMANDIIIFVNTNGGSGPVTLGLIYLEFSTRDLY